jgi:cysteinyl-tRNA synthetase
MGAQPLPCGPERRRNAAASGGVIDARHARKAKNFVGADRIRTGLALKRILLEEGPGGTTGQRAG